MTGPGRLLETFGIDIRENVLEPPAQILLFEEAQEGVSDDGETINYADTFGYQRDE
jgi:hypothetical protein